MCVIHFAFWLKQCVMFSALTVDVQERSFPKLWKSSAFQIVTIDLLLITFADNSVPVNFNFLSLPTVTSQNERDTVIPQSFSEAYSSWPKKWFRAGHGCGLPVCLGETTAFISGSYLFIDSSPHSRFTQAVLEAVWNNIKCSHFRVQSGHGSATN
jgi:hypothetical protein